MAALSQDLAERDARDTQRAAAPLKPAEGAQLLDTSDMTIEQAFAVVGDADQPAATPVGDNLDAPRAAQVLAERGLPVQNALVPVMNQRFTN